jgi:hypothetical protein
MKTLLLVLFSCFSVLVSAQTRTLEMTHYIFPEFVRGTVVLHKGGTTTAMVNYNALTEEMIFDKQGKKLAMTNLADIDTVLIEGRVFIPYKKTFIELIHKNKFELFVAHKCSLIEPGKPAAYGGTSQTSATTAVSSISAGGQIYELALPDGYTTRPYTEYLLNKDGRMTSFLSLRQLSKIFDSQSDQFKSYTKTHKVDYDNRESLVELVKFMEQP